jgi:DNA-binding XRE family transcriptional regulator
MPGGEDANVGTQMTERRNEAYGRLLRARREAIGLTQAELALLASVNRVTIGVAESGKPIANKTHYNVLCALGCAPNVRAWDDSGIPQLEAVFSPRVAGLAARAVLTLSEDEAAGGPLVTADYLELVAELSKGRILPMQYGLCNDIAAAMRPLEAELFDAEVAVAASDYDVRWIDGKRVGGTPRPRTIHATARVAGLGSVQVTGGPALTQEGAPGAPTLTNLIADGLSGDSALARLALQGIEAGVPQAAIVYILQADISEENRQRLMQHAVRRAASLQQSLIDEIAVMTEMMVRQ